MSANIPFVDNVARISDEDNMYYSSRNNQLYMNSQPISEWIEIGSLTSDDSCGMSIDVNPDYFMKELKCPHCEGGGNVRKTIEKVMWQKNKIKGKMFCYDCETYFWGTFTLTEIQKEEVIDD